MVWDHRVRHRAGLARLVAGLAVFGLPLLTGEGVGAADTPPGSTQTVYLEYHEFGPPLPYPMFWELDITPQFAPFKKEPDWGGRLVRRGTINSAFRGGERPDTNAAATINLAFAWDYNQGKLCLDANRNGDLTDDAVCSAEPQPGNQSSQNFTSLHLKLSPAAQSHPVLVDLCLVVAKGRNDLRGGLAWRSCWQGKVVLPGREYQVGLIEHPNYLGSTREAWLLFRPWEQRNETFFLYVTPSEPSYFEFGTNLFVGGQAYRLNGSYLPGDTPRYKLELSEAQLELGELALSGQFIQRLLLKGHKAKEPFTVVLDRPGPKVRIPRGTYTNCSVVLKEQAVAALGNYQDWSTRKRITIRADKTAVLAAGGPLTNSVTVRKRGRTLTFDYELLGAGGRYQLLTTERAKPPQLAIYQSGKRVASGTFEFG